MHMSAAMVGQAGAEVITHSERAKRSSKSTELACIDHSLLSYISKIRQVTYVYTNPNRARNKDQLY